jgi:hypothetical protein
MILETRHYSTLPPFFRHGNKKTGGAQINHHAVVIAQRPVFGRLTREALYSSDFEALRHSDVIDELSFDAREGAGRRDPEGMWKRFH